MQTEPSPLSSQTRANDAIQDKISSNLLEKSRQRALERQKIYRFDKYAKYHNIENLLQSSSPPSSTSSTIPVQNIKSDEINTKKPKILSKFANYLTRPFNLNSGQQFPSNLGETSICIPIPRGQRILVLIGNKKTLFIGLDGTIIKETWSHFPNGNRTGSVKPNQFILLDAVLVLKRKTVYIIDCLRWTLMMLFEAPPVDRRKFCAMKLSEIPSLKYSHKRSPFRYFLVPHYSSLKLPLQNLVRHHRNESTKPTPEYPLTQPVIGFLFLHRESRYCVYESNPLALYLSLSKISLLRDFYGD